MKYLTQFTASLLLPSLIAGSLSVIAVLIFVQAERVRRKDDIRLELIEWRWILMEASLIAASAIEAKGAYVLATARPNTSVAMATIISLAVPVLLSGIYLAAGIKIGRVRPISAASTLFSATTIVLIAGLQHGRSSLTMELAAAWLMLVLSSIPLVSTRFRLTRG